MQAPLISAIVSTYAAARFMDGCLRDLRAQTLGPRIEILVVDTASPQNEGEIVRRHQRDCDNIRYIHVPQRETSTLAINRAIAQARGRYLTIANTDDRHRPDALERQVEVLERFDEFGIVYADSVINRIENEEFSDTQASTRFDWPDFSLNTALNVCLFGPHPVWRRSVHQTCGLFDPRHPIASDQDMFLHIAWRFGAVHLRETLGMFLRRPDSMSGTDHKTETMADVMRVLTRYRQRIPRTDLFPALSSHDADPLALAAAEVEYGNLCALGPYTDLQMALQAYRRAVELSRGSVAALQVEALFHNNAGCALACLGRPDLALQALAATPTLPCATRNARRIREGGKRRISPLELTFAEDLHPVVRAARRSRGLRFDAGGKLCWSATQECRPWEVYEGPNGVPMSPREQAAFRRPKESDTHHGTRISPLVSDTNGGTPRPRSRLAQSHSTPQLSSSHSTCPCPPASRRR